VYNASKRYGQKEAAVGRRKRVEKLRVEFETLDTDQKDYLLGIAKALAFADASQKIAGGFSPPEPAARKAEQEKTGAGSMKSRRK
jgi:hypothetical protein